MPETERLEEIRAFFKFNKKTFTEILGNSTPQSYTNFLNGSSGLSLRMIRGLKGYDPRINIDWVLTGQGQMLLSNDNSNDQKIIHGDVTNAQIGHNNEFNNNSNINPNTKEIEYLKKEIEHLKVVLEEKDERLKDREGRLKDKDRLISMLEKNQK
ncbi:MAG: hypothetical protein JKY03_05395 [Aureispira sp.]|nr:hypothetical protein [Aureispira sp.]